MDEEMTTEERTLGRRAVDSALLLRWIPFLSLIILMVTQTIYFTRYISGLELSNTQLISTVTKLEAKVEQLSANMAQGVVPSAQSQWRLEMMERQINEYRQIIGDNGRRLALLEARLRGGAER